MSMRVLTSGIDSLYSITLHRPPQLTSRRSITATARPSNRDARATTWKFLPGLRRLLHNDPVRGMTESLTIGRRVAWYRRRRGMTQEILADVLDRTIDWVSKVENDRIPLDRLSVIAQLADALDVTVRDLLAEPSLMDWTPDSGRRTVPVLRDVLLDYRQITPALRPAGATAPPAVGDLRQRLVNIMDAYQASRYGVDDARTARTAHPRAPRRRRGQ
jgi:transcriptional regulator with XRE-family HTH domain